MIEYYLLIGFFLYWLGSVVNRQSDTADWYASLAWVIVWPLAIVVGIVQGMREKRK